MNRMEGRYWKDTRNGNHCIWCGIIVFLVIRTWMRRLFDFPQVFFFLLLLAVGLPRKYLADSTWKKMKTIKLINATFDFVLVNGRRGCRACVCVCVNVCMYKCVSIMHAPFLKGTFMSTLFNRTTLFSIYICLQAFPICSRDLISLN